MSWHHVVIEGFCLGFGPKKPCGKNVSVACLRDGHCPYFAYADSNEREAALFVPLHQILTDRIRSVCSDVWYNITWYLWNKWFYDPNWIKKYGAATCPDPELDEIENKQKDRFSEWIKGGKE